MRIERDEYDKELINYIHSMSRKISKGRVIAQPLEEFLRDPIEPNNERYIKNSSFITYELGDVSSLFTPPVSKKIKYSVRYFSDRFFDPEDISKVSVLGPELDYGGVTFNLNQDFSVIPGLYVIGDCTGKFRGILQSMASGLICGESIINGN